MGTQRLQENYIIGGYKICGHLGSGASGVVYRATKNGKDFALKINNSKFAGDRIQSLNAFKKEVATVARISHENMARVLDFGEDKDLLYLVMELVEGESLASRLRSGPLDPPELSRLAQSMGSLLATLHAFGMVHRDIKPSNIMMSNQGTFKLIDFGFAGDFEELEQDAARDSTMGTLLYSSPEQSGVLKRAIDGRSDLYSLGIVLYESATGRLPFQSENVSEILRMHATVKPKDPKDLNPMLSPVFAKIILKLMEKDPDDRYQSAAGLVSDLHRIADFEKAVLQNETWSLGTTDAKGGRALRMPIAGRRKEVKIIADAWTACRQGHGQIVVLSGEGGMGKSRITREIFRDVKESNQLVLSSKCTPMEIGKPLAAVSQMFDHYVQELLDGPVEKKDHGILLLRQAAGNSSSLISNLCDGLKLVLDTSKSLNSISSESERSQFAVEVCRFIGELADLTGGLLFLVDDIQWLDSASQDLLSQFANSIADHKVLFLMTARNDAESKVSVDTFTQTIKTSAFEDLLIGPLELESVQNMVVAFLGTESAHPEIARKIHTLSEGNPFVVSEYLSNFLSSGCFHLVDQEWRLDEDRLASANLSNNIYQLVLQRVEGLSEELKTILRIAAVFRNRFDEKSLGLIAQIDAKSLHLQLEKAIRAHLIEQTDGQDYLFIHDRIREALLNSIDQEQLTQIYDRIADAVDQGIDPHSDKIYDLAFYYSRSTPGRKPERVFETNFQAGLKAMSNYTFRQAFEFFGKAEKEARLYSVKIASELVFFREFGKTCQNLGMADEAHRLFDQALLHTNDRFERAQIYNFKVMTLSGEGRIEEAWEVFKNTLPLLGRKYPSNLISYVLSLFWFLLVGNFLTLTRLGRGLFKERTDSRIRREYQLLTSIYENSYLLAYFSGKPFDVMQITIRQYFYAHFLGDGPELLKAHVAQYIMWTFLLIRPVSRFHIREGHAIAERLKDPALRIYNKMWSSMAIEVMADQANDEKSSGSMVDEIHKYLGAWLVTLHIADLTYQLLMNGRAKQAVEKAQAYLPLMDEFKCITFMANLRGLLYSQLIILGRFNEAFEVFKDWVPIARRLGDAYKYCATGVPGHQFIAMYEQGDFSPEIDTHIENFQNFHLEDYHYRVFHCWIGYIRIAQLERASTKQEKELALRRLNSIIWGLNWRSMTAIHRCHYHTIRAAKFRIVGQLNKAKKLLDKAEGLARHSKSLFGQFQILEERARLERAGKNMSSAQHFARQALQMAIENSWVLRARRVSHEFQIPLAELSPVSGGHMQTSSLGRSKEIQLVDSLLRVSLAAAVQSNPAQQASSALDEIIKILAADRGFIFTFDNQTKSVQFIVGRDVDLKTLEEPTAYSNTVIKKVLETRGPVIVAGSDEMTAIGSESAVIHGLRSIMAVPLMLRDELKGAVYVDSKMARGLFTENDVSAFSALASHIAIAFENRRILDIEVERKEVQKDLEVGMAVQRMFLPPRVHQVYDKVEVTGFYRAAVQCGGDWWWHKDLGDGRIWLFVGDVTGHGVGPAMITATIAGLFESYFPRDQGQMPELLEKVSRTLRNLTQERYLVSALAVEIDQNSDILRAWNMGSPGFIHVPQDDAVNPFSIPGALIGGENFQPGLVEIPLNDNDRIFISTDGLTELRLPNGRMLGVRKVIKLMDKIKAAGGQEAIAGLVKEIDAVRMETPQDDDVTIVLIDYKGLRRSAS